MSRAVTISGLVIVAAATLSACNVGPDHAPPDVNTGSGWTQADVNRAANRGLATWWTTLKDPTLTMLIETALAQNLDLRTARARVAEARAMADRTAGGRVPTITANGSVTRQKLSENSANPAGQIPTVPVYQTIYDAGFDANWELDLFGRLDDALDASVARLDAAIANQRAARQAVIAEVARSYLRLRGAQARLNALEQQIDALEQTSALIAFQFEVGEVGEADVAQADSELAALQGDRPGLATEVLVSALALGILVGEPPKAGLGIADAAGSLPTLAAIPVGARAEVLARRPDVSAAERELAAATADVGLATAELYPRVGLSGSAGFQALDTGNLFESGSRRWNITPFMSWRIFEGGRVKAEIRATQARQQQAAIAFEQAVLSALTEAEQALARYQGALDTLAARRRALEAARSSDGFAATRYAEGEISLLARLDADRALRRAEAVEIGAHQQAATELVALYKALGGGWTRQDPDS